MSINILLRSIFFGALLQATFAHATLSLCEKDESGFLHLKLTTPNLIIQTFGLEDNDAFVGIVCEPELASMYTRTGAPLSEEDKPFAIERRNFKEEVRGTPLKAYGIWRHNEGQKGTLLGVSTFHKDVYPDIAHDWRIGWIFKTGVEEEGLPTAWELQKETLRAMITLAFDLLPEEGLQSIALGFRTDDAGTLQLLHELDEAFAPNATFLNGGYSPDGAYFKMRSLWYQSDRSITWQTYCLTKTLYETWKSASPHEWHLGQPPQAPSNASSSQQ